MPLLNFVKVPGAAMNATKREYYQKDLLDWASYAGVQIQFPETFPIHTVLPLRVTLAAACDPQMITTLCKKCDLHCGITL